MQVAHRTTGEAAELEVHELAGLRNRDLAATHIIELP
jgi:hypothetical protein